MLAVLELWVFKVHKYLKGGGQEDGARLFSVLLSNRMRSKEQKLMHRKFHSNMRKNFFAVQVTKNWNRLSRESVESPSLDIFQRQLDTILSDKGALGDPA